MSYRENGTKARRHAGTKWKRHARAGFSLVEIMVVLVIIGLLAAAVTVNVRSYLIRAKRSTATMEITAICDALDTYYATFDRFPTNDQGLGVLSKPSEKLPEPLLKQAPIDPWGNPYIYNCPGRQGTYEVISYGADGREGGNSADADVNSWDLKDRGRAAGVQP
jgi:general secretion pathway protein G